MIDAVLSHGSDTGFQNPRIKLKGQHRLQAAVRQLDRILPKQIEIRIASVRSVDKRALLQLDQASKWSSMAPSRDDDGNSP